MDCPNSHNVSLIVSCDRLRKNALKNRKRRLKKKELRKRRKADEAVKCTDMANDNDSRDGDIEQRPCSGINSLDKAGNHNNLKTDSCSLSTSKVSNQRVLETGSLAQTDTATETVARTCHRAGVDAFMTGFSHAVFSMQLGEGDIDMLSLSNKLYLSGKNVPLQVTKGNFGKLSQAHQDRIRLYADG